MGSEAAVTRKDNESFGYFSYWPLSCRDIYDLAAFFSYLPGYISERAILGWLNRTEFTSQLTRLA